MKSKALLHLFWVLLPIIVRFALTSYPFIVDVNVEAASVTGNTLHLEGTITIDPTKVPPELQYNHNGFLPWWEQNIDNVIAQNKFWGKFVHVESIELSWETIGGIGENDVIRFVVDVEVTIGKSVRYGEGFTPSTLLI